MSRTARLGREDDDSDGDGAGRSAPAPADGSAADAHAGDRPTDASTILGLGIVGFVLCVPVAPYAWIRANEHIAACRARNLPIDGMARAGQVLGILGTCMVLGCVLVIVIALLG